MLRPSQNSPNIFNFIKTSLLTLIRLFLALIFPQHKPNASTSPAWRQGRSWQAYCIFGAYFKRRWFNFIKRYYGTYCTPIPHYLNTPHDGGGVGILCAYLWTKAHRDFRITHLLTVLNTLLFKGASKDSLSVVYFLQHCDNDKQSRA